MNHIQTAFHRNGISGKPFTVGIVDNVKDCRKEQRFLIVQFADKSNTAVFDLELLAKGNIKFTENSFRGDVLADEFEHGAEIEIQRADTERKIRNVENGQTWRIKEN